MYAGKGQCTCCPHVTRPRLFSSQGEGGGGETGAKVPRGWVGRGTGVEAEGGGWRAKGRPGLQRICPREISSRFSPRSKMPAAATPSAPAHQRSSTQPSHNMVQRQGGQVRVSLALLRPSALREGGKKGRKKGKREGRGRRPALSPAWPWARDFLNISMPECPPTETAVTYSLHCARAHHPPSGSAALA
jgi:hypothetical protein